MSVQIENITNRPVLLRLNSGETLHLAPRAVSMELLEVEVNDNPKVQKLLERQVIQVWTLEKKQRPSEESEKMKTPSGKGKK